MPTSTPAKPAAPKELPLIVPSKSALKKAGEALRSCSEGPEFDRALQMLSAWRGLFAYPLNTFSVMLRKKCSMLKISDAIVARRLKRTPSIVAKLRRFSGMDLGRMQDIGGLRVIVNNLDEVYKFWNSLQNSKIKHEAVVPPHDYIKTPKPDGYRSLHQVYRYQSEDHPELCGLQVEVQIRTKLQHAWATAVETLGAIEQASFKSGEGTDKHKQFFKLASALISLHEKASVLEEFSNTPRDELVRQFSAIEKELNVFQKLTGIAVATSSILSPKAEKAEFQVMMLDPVAGTLSLTPFSRGQAQVAERFYSFLEATEKDKLIVLVSVDNLRALKKAYPNYFLDTKLFVDTLKRICEAK